MNRVCVFCGSRHGVDPRHAAAARALGRELAARGTGLVYGGGNVGLMGEVAAAVVEAGGHVLGVIPTSLAEKELAYAGATELVEVGTMHERKALMADRADGFVALPGGYGTLDELFEILTWAQLGIHAKPVVLFNSAGFFDPLLALADHLVREGFLRPRHRALIRVAATAPEVLAALTAPGPSPDVKWATPDER
jgi:hypothetical protein